MSFHFPSFYNSYFPNKFNNYTGSPFPYNPHRFTNKPNSNISSASDINSSTLKDENSVQFKNTNSNNPSISQNSNENCFFEIFGLKLQFDDVLLIVLIFFLYNEGIKDEELFIILVLLLLS